MTLDINATDLLALERASLIAERVRRDADGLELRLMAQVCQNSINGLLERIEAREVDAPAPPF
jgi:hypothetical protein